MSDEINKKDIDIDKLVERAITNQNFFSELLIGLTSKNDIIRYNCHKILTKISEENPNQLYSKWNYLEDLLNSPNNYHKLIAIELIANLTKVDVDNKFDAIFETYYSIINSEKTMVAGHLAGVSGKIVKNKPKLQNKITKRLLNIDNTHQGKQVELIKAYIIDAFTEYFEEAENKEEIKRFVEQQITSKSPKTRKKAQDFLNTHSI